MTSPDSERAGSDEPDDDVTSRVIAVIAGSHELPLEKVTLDTTFEELGFDSLDGVNIAFDLEEEFDIEIPDEEAEKIGTVADAIAYIETAAAAAS